MWKLLPAAAIVIAVAAPACAAGPSFDCRKPGLQPLAELICAEPKLAELDVAFAQSYHDLRLALAPEARDILAAEDRRFLADTVEECGIVPSTAIPMSARVVVNKCVAVRYFAKAKEWIAREHAITGRPARTIVAPYFEEPLPPGFTETPIARSANPLAQSGSPPSPLRAPPLKFVPFASPQLAPDVAFTDLDGKPVKLTDFRGKLVVLNLWTTSCPPCLEQMPSLEQLQINVPDKLVVIAVSADRGGKQTVEPFLTSLGLKKSKVYLDPRGEVGRAFQAAMLPTSMFIGADGKLLGKIEGATEWDSVEMRDVVIPLLPKNIPAISSFQKDLEVKLFEENGVYKVPVMA